MHFVYTRIYMFIQSTYMIWNHLGFISGPFRDHFGIITESFGGHFGVIWGAFWGHLCDFFRTTRIFQNVCFTIVKQYFLRSGRVLIGDFFMFFLRAGHLITGPCHHGMGVCSGEPAGCEAVRGLAAAL